MLKQAKKAVGRINPRKWFSETMYLTFICPVSLQLAQCGPTGEGFVIKQPKEELRKAMPYLRVGLQVLKVSVAAGRCFGLPLPYVGAIETKMEKAKLEADAVTKLLATCKDLCEDPASASSLDKVMGGTRELETRDRGLMNESAQETLRLLEKVGGKAIAQILLLANPYNTTLGPIININ